MEELETRAVKAACRFFDRRGYDVLETGWECAAGTADIVAEDGDTLVFVKVRVRTGAEGFFALHARSIENHLACKSLIISA